MLGGSFPGSKQKKLVVRSVIRRVGIRITTTMNRFSFHFSYRDRAWFCFYEMYPSPFVKRVAVSNCLAICTFWHATKLPFEKRRTARPLSSFIVRPTHGRGDGLGSDKIGTQMNILACGMGLK